MPMKFTLHPVTSSLRSGGPARAVLQLRCWTLAALCAAVSLPALATERGPARNPTAQVTASAAPLAVTAAPPAEVEARVIVKFKADSSLMRALAASPNMARPQHAQALATRLGVSLADGRVLGPRSQVVKAAVGSGLSSRALADRLSALSDVEYAVVDGRMQALAGVPNDPLYAAQATTSPAAGQWYLRPPTSTTIVDTNSVVAAINAETAWAITPGLASVVVAVLDTGVRLDHPDLSAKLLPGYDFIHDVGIANDGDGADADASDPGDAVTAAEVNQVGGPFYHLCGQNPDTGVYEGQKSSWHGTQTAGLIGAATDNGIGMAGTGRNIMVLPVRVLGKCGGFDSDIQAAIRWAAGVRVDGVPANANPAKVINLSLGSTGACNSAYRDVVAEVNALGVVVVAAAGNDGLAVGTPANCPNVIAVAGVRHVGTKVGYSDLGPEIAIAAPAGNCVNNAGGPCLYPLLTTSNSGTTTPVAGAAGAIYTDGAASASLGTSFSAPLVSGTLGLMLSANRALTPAQALSALKSAARPFPATGGAAGLTACTAPTSVAQNTECYCTTTTCGAGLLDAGAAVAAVVVVNASIAVASSSAAVGTPITLDGSGSRASGSSIASYQWSIVSGAGATFSGATNAATATVSSSAAGSVVVRLTVTDGNGVPGTASTTLAFSAPAAAPTPTPTPAPSGGGGGGGAMHGGWLVGWLLAVFGVWVVTPRRPA